MMFFKQVVGTILNSKILIYSFALDISIVSFKINYRLAEIFHSYAISAKSPYTGRIYIL